MSHTKSKFKEVSAIIYRTAYFRNNLYHTQEMDHLARVSPKAYAYMMDIPLIDWTLIHDWGHRYVNSSN